MCNDSITKALASAIEEESMQRQIENEVIASQVKIEMVLRELHPTLQDAWERYQTILKLVGN